MYKDYQSLSNRFKRLLWSLKAIFPYIFKKNKNTISKRTITILIGEYPRSFIGWMKENETLKVQRETTLSLPGVTKYLIYFFEELKEYKVSENLILKEFPNSYEGVREYFKFLYTLNPQFMQIHNVILSGYIDLLVKIVMKIDTIFMPRGMNYYNDYIFRQDKSLKGKIKGNLNNFLNQQALKKSKFVNAPAFFALESELASARSVYTSDYLYCQGAVSIQMNIKETVLERLKDIHSQIIRYEKKIFMFTRVDKMKIDSAIDDYVSIESKLGNSCLVIIGDGPALDHFKVKFKEKKNIFFTGWIDKWDAFPFIKDFDIMLAPHGGYSIIEMGMLGIPTVAYNYDIMSDLIYNKYNGYLIDKETKSEMKDILIEYFSKSIAQRDNMKKNIKNSFYDRFCLETFEIEKRKLVSKLFGGYNNG